MRARYSRTLGLASVTLLLVGWAAAGTARAQSLRFREYEIKMAFLYNFMKFVDWPDEAHAVAGTPIIVGILGDDPFDVAIDSISGKTVKGRPIIVKRLESARSVDSCHVLFIGRSQDASLPEILDAVRRSSILTVGESTGFIEHGGIINLVIQDNRVRFDINPDAANRVGLKISSKLLTLARLTG